MHYRTIVVGVMILSLFFGVFSHTLVPVRAAQKTVNIKNNVFDKNNLVLVVGDVVKFDNEDLVFHTVVITRVADGSVFDRLSFNPAKESGSSRTKTFSRVDDYVVILDDGLAEMFVSVIVATPSTTALPTHTFFATPSYTPNADSSVTHSSLSLPSVLPTHTPFASPSDSHHSSPFASATSTSDATSAPTFEPILSPHPSVLPTAVPAVFFTPAPSIDADVSLTPTPAVRVLPVAIESAVPSVLLSATPIPSLVARESPYPHLTPFVTPYPRVTLSPTVSPTIPPVPDVLPSFSVFRKTTCSSSFLSDDRSLLSNKLSPLYLTQGHWLVFSLVQDGLHFQLEATLHQIRIINLFFRGNPFFGGIMLSYGGDSVSISGVSRLDVLRQMNAYWCSRSL